MKITASISRNTCNPCGLTDGNKIKELNELLHHYNQSCVLQVVAYNVDVSKPGVSFEVPKAMLDNKSMTYLLLVV